jgi:hypothetical protein
MSSTLSPNTKMLKRAPPDPADRRRRRAAERQRRYRERLRTGDVVVRVEVPVVVITMLLDLGWLQAEESEDRRQIGEAIARLLPDAARHHQRKNS